MKERKDILDSVKRASEAHLEDMRKNPEKYAKIHEKAIANSKYFQERSRIAKEKEAIRQANVKKTHSTYGKHWITNGSTNKFWDPKSGEIPEGFYLGKVIKKKE